MANGMKWFQTAAINLLLHLNMPYTVLPMKKNLFSFPDSAAQLISDYIYDGQCASNVFDFSDCNDQRIARTTGKLETGKTERPGKPE
jgi:hypothetical protein